MRRDFDEHSDDTLRLTATSTPYVIEFSGHRFYHDRVDRDWLRQILVDVRDEQRRIQRQRRQWWKRTAFTFTWLVLVLTAAALIIIGGWS